jgi:hypothetical protein
VGLCVPVDPIREQEPRGKRLDYIDVSNTWKTLAVLGFVLAVACFCGGALALAFNLGMSKNT